MIEKLKEFGEGVISRAMTSLTIEGCVPPVLIVLKNGASEVDTVDLPMADEDEIRGCYKILNDKAKEDGVEAMVLLMQAHVKNLAEDEDVPHSLKDDPDAMEAIYLAIFQRERTVVRQVLYSNENGTPAFMDMGWDEVDDEWEGFANPWRTSTPD